VRVLLNLCIRLKNWIITRLWRHIELQWPGCISRIVNHSLESWQIILRSALGARLNLLAQSEGADGRHQFFLITRAKCESALTWATPASSLTRHYHANHAAPSSINLITRPEQHFSCWTRGDYCLWCDQNCDYMPPGGGSYVLSFLLLNSTF